MSPRMHIWSTCRALAVRTRPAAQPRIETLRLSTRTQTRLYADDATPKSTNATGSAPKVNVGPAGSGVGKASSGETAQNAQEPLSQGASVKVGPKGPHCFEIQCFNANEWN